MKLKAKVTIHAGKGVYAPGEVVAIRDDREALSLIERGFAEETDLPVTVKAEPESVFSRLSGKLTKIKAKISIHTGKGVHSPGDVLAIGEEEAKSLIARGFAEGIDEQPPQKSDPAPPVTRVKPPEPPPQKSSPASQVTPIEAHAERENDSPDKTGGPAESE